MLDPVFMLLYFQHILCLYSYLICFLTKFLWAAYISGHVLYSPIDGWVWDQWNVYLCVYCELVFLSYFCVGSKWATLGD